MKIESIWAGVPRPQILKDILKDMCNKKLEPLKRQKAMNLLNAAIGVMKTVKGRENIIAYLSEQIEFTRNELYPRRMMNEVQKVNKDKKTKKTKRPIRKKR